MRQAVCLLIGDYMGKFLGVARRENHEEWGLPGGKVDPGENHITAAIRELKEETSLIVNGEDLIPVFTDICFGKDGENFLCTTFFVKNYYGDPSRGDAGPVEWHYPEALADGPFGHYNKGLFDAAQRFGLFRIKSGVPIIDKLMDEGFPKEMLSTY